MEGNGDDGADRVGLSRAAPEFGDLVAVDGLGFEPAIGYAVVLFALGSLRLHRAVSWCDRGECDRGDEPLRPQRK